jgi:osmotically-inducible protein OsmY
VRGVRTVEDELRVDPRDHWKDEELRGAALQAPMSDDSVPTDWLDVTVTAGRATLTGEVKHQSDSDAAFVDVSRLAGVGGITNEIRVMTADLGG